MRLLPAALLLVAAIALAGSVRVAVGEEDRSQKWWLFIGTYTDGASKGIYRLQMDVVTGKLSEPELAAETPNPSFLAVHPSRKFLYAVGETGEPGGGTVAAFALDPASGALRFLNRRPAAGNYPCHIVVDANGKNVLVANYGSGNAAVLPVGDEGRLAEASCVVQHRGAGANPQRQEGPHAHSVNLDRANRFAFVADLGLDKVFIYRYGAGKGTLTANDPASVSVAAGSGPRHFAFHPDGKHAYVINELASTITAMDYDPGRGILAPVQTVSTLPGDFKGRSGTAEVQVHPSRKFLYGSNRGHDSIAIFSIDASSGKLTPVGHQAEGIKVPRNFGIDPTGTFLVVANQDADSLVVFRIDPRTGALQPTGHTAKVPRPVCVKFVPAIP
jgi:6-phosphogluconolactonase